MALADFYRSKEWERFRRVLINERVNEQGFVVCAHCGKPIVKAYDIIGHHTIELTEENYTDADISLNPELVVLVHHACHNRIHEKLAKLRRQQVFLVYGSPLSGKSSYVAEVMQAGDMVIDIDRIWECVSGLDKYTKPDRLKAVVFGVRDNLLEAVKYRRGKWANCYIVGGYAFKGERERLLDSLGAREVFIDTPKETCLERLHNASDGRDVKAWTKYIDDWWKQYGGGF